MGMVDLASREGATLFCERKREEMRRMFEQKGRFEVAGYSVCAYAFVTHAAGAPSLPGVTAQLITVPFEARPFLSAATFSPLFAETIRNHCRLGRAVGVVTMHEMWWRSAPIENASQTLGEVLAHARAAAPSEVLYLKLEHQHAGVRAWRAIIERPERGPARLAPWRELDGVLRTGNFDDLLDSKATAAS